jgi:hypothetical protein
MLKNNDNVSWGEARSALPRRGEFFMFIRRRLMTVRSLCVAMLLAFGGVRFRAAAEPTLQAFSEVVVAGSKDDFMIVRHLTLRGSNEAIGHKLAEIAQSRHGVEPSADTIERTKKRWQFYKSKYPTHHARAAGAANFFGAPADGPADTLALWFNIDVAPACSVVYYPPDYTAAGHAMLSRNYDFTTGMYSDLIGAAPAEGTRPMTADPYIIEMYSDEGHASLYVCAYDLLGGCIDGVNSQGLTVALLANNDPFGTTPPQPSRMPRPGLAEIELTRFLLDRCATVDEAGEALKTIPVYYSLMPCHYIVGDASGRSIVWEYTNDLQQRHLVEGRGRPQVITNHPIYKYEADSTKRPPAKSAESFGRLRRLEAEIENAPKARSVEEIKRTNACVRARSSAGQRVPGLPASLNRTLWHAVYDCQDRSMEVDFYLGEDPAAPNGEKRSGYLRFKLDGTNSVARGK